MISNKTRRRVTILRLIIVIGILLLTTTCQKSPENHSATNESSPSPAATSTEEAKQTTGSTSDVNVSGTLQESRHNRDNIVPRIFNVLTSETNQAKVTFEVNKSTDRFKINEIHGTILNMVEQVLDRFPIKTAEKPEFLVLEKDGSGKLLEQPQFYGKLSLIPYGAIENGQLLEIVVKALAYESEPWVDRKSVV